MAEIEDKKEEMCIYSQASALLCLSSAWRCCCKLTLRYPLQIFHFTADLVRLLAWQTCRVIIEEHKTPTKKMVSFCTPTVQDESLKYLVGRENSAFLVLSLVASIEGINEM